MGMVIIFYRTYNMKYLHTQLWRDERDEVYREGKWLNVRNSK